MGEIIHEPVAVGTTVKHSTLMPSSMLWRGRIYQFLSCGMQYTRYEGDVRVHIFYMTTNESCMQITFNTQTLRWRLSEIEAI